MIFQHTHEQVLAGTKTQTRRVCGESVDVVDPVAEGFADFPGVPENPYALDLDSGRLLWGVHRTYAVQPGRGKRALGRIRVTGLRIEHLQAITEADARAEGVDSVQAYAALWDAIHSKRGERWSDNPLVVVIQFELADASQR